MDESNIVKKVFVARILRYLDQPNIEVGSLRKSPIFDILDVCQKFGLLGIVVNMASNMSLVMGKEA